jgi:hypothetical protein
LLLLLGTIKGRDDYAHDLAHGALAGRQLQQTRTIR